MEKQVLATVVTPQAKGDEPEITISTIALDRDQDEILPEGGSFTDYQRNPVVGFGHFREETIPVGVTTSLDVIAGRGIRARWRWLKGDPFAERVRNAFEQGVLRAASIGFLPTASEPNGKGGWRYTSWQMLEWSIVPLPANPEAVRTLKGLGLWSADGVVLELIDDRPDEPHLEIADAFADALRRRAISRHSEPFEPVCDIPAAEVRRMLRCVVAEGIGSVVRDAAVSAISRIRGRVE